MNATRRTVPFIKMNGLGNDFVVFDFVTDVPFEIHQHRDASSYYIDNQGRVAMARLLHQHMLQSPTTWEFPRGVLRKIASRTTGVGCDQLVAVCDGNATPTAGETIVQQANSTYMHYAQQRGEQHSVDAVPRMWCAARLFNGPDGGEVGMCGNAVRCIALYWYVQCVLHYCWVQLKESSTLPTVDQIALLGTSVAVVLPYSRRKLVSEVLEFPVGDLLRAFAKIAPSLVSSTQSFESIKYSVVAYCLSSMQCESCDVRVDSGVTDAAATFPAFREHRVGTSDIPLELLKTYLHSMPGVDPTGLAGIAAAYAVSVGNPHCVLVASDAYREGDEAEGGLPVMLSDAFVDAVGEAINRWTDVFPQGANVEFAAARPDATVGNVALRMRVFERGAGRTLACGSGACASGVAMHAHLSAAAPLVLATRVEMDGGELLITTTHRANNDVAIIACGPAAFNFFGSWLPAL